jgi:ATP-dependent Clp protease ATP-binding subunit ClpC
MAQADTAMRQFRHQYLGTEHVLLGLLTAGDNLAATALARLGITEQHVRDAIADIIGYGDTPDGVCHGIVPRLKRALERARAEAKHSNHRLARSEHLLLAIATSDGVATEILQRHGIDERKLRDQIADLLPEAPEIATAIRRGPRRRSRLRRS